MMRRLLSHLFGSAAIIATPKLAAVAAVVLHPLGLRLVGIFTLIYVSAAMVVAAPLLSWQTARLLDQQARLLLANPADSGASPARLPADTAIAMLAADGRLRWHGGGLAGLRHKAAMLPAQNVTAGLGLTILLHWQQGPQRYDLVLQPPHPFGTTVILAEKVALVLPANHLSLALRHHMLALGGFALLLYLLLLLPCVVLTILLVIRPLRRLTWSLTDFARDPATPRPPPVLAATDAGIAAAVSALTMLQQNTRQHLRQREKLAALGEAVTKINHDMRNVLAAALLMADGLSNSQEPRIQRAGKQVIRAVERAVGLCRAMLGYLDEPLAARPETQNMPELLAEVASQAGIAVIWQGPQQLELDRALIHRLLLNLVRNAATAGANQVEITLWRAGRLAVMDIADNGPGMTADERARLFRPFASGTRGSSGLGLSIARDIALAHGGDLKLSRSSSAGTEFRLRLPDTVFGIVPKRRWWSAP